MSKQKRMMQRVWLIFGFAVILFIGSFYQAEVDRQALNSVTAESLYENRQSDVQLEVSGEVTRLLPDDNDGSRHQRFIVELPSGLTLMVAHNIDLAPRVANLQVGDEIDLYGEYVWNDKGGILHWTHHDPANRHPHGWIRHDDNLYQ
ncbi:MAG: DUF3465 domain-containing protein [Methylophaga sp.]|nr:DUF3465 domain-containing protein [Methylophaga sp.]